MDYGSIVVPDLEQVDNFLQIHCGGDYPQSDLSVIKEAKFEKRLIQEFHDDGSVTEAEKLMCVEDPVLTGYGSSEVIDSDGDEFMEPALKSLCKAPPGMSLWMNHEMKLPEKYMGQLHDEPQYTFGQKGDSNSIRPMNAPWAGVRINGRVEMLNHPARQLYAFIKKGSRFGWSVGCRYLDYKRKTDARGAVKGFKVFEVKPIEWSIVGVPANPECWVELTRKMFVVKGILPASEDDPEMAYVFKHWDEFGTMAPRIRAFATEMYDTFGLVLAEPATGKRMSWPGR